MNVILDIAAMIGAVVWPVVILVILLAYRRIIPRLAEGFVGRLNKLSFAGFSLELAQAKPFSPAWPASSTALDLRHQAAAVQITDSSRAAFLTQLNDAGTGDFAEINLGRGAEWLTSRLFIMAILFSRMKGLRCFVFVEATEAVRHRYVGWAEPERIRWALAQRFPWLEKAYADAYAELNTMRNAVIVSHQGRLGYDHAPNDPLASIDLLSAFLRQIQTPIPAPIPPAPAGAVGPPIVDAELITIDANTKEHANWLTAEELENILGEDLSKASVRASELRTGTHSAQVKAVLAVPGPFVAIVADDGRFDYLIRRDILMEQVAKLMAAEPEERG